MRFVFYASLVFASLLVSGVAEAKSPIQRQQLRNSVIPAVQQSKILGPASGSEILYLAVSLEPRFPAELKAFCDSGSNPNSPNYRHFLTPEQVGENFGATSTDVNNVVAFLKSQGMEIT